jgi:hypothetical protein
MRFQLFLFLALSAVCLSASALIFNLSWPALSEGYSESIAGPLDLNSATEFSQKIDTIQAMDGPKIALIGDSFIFSKTMADESGEKWRSQTLDKHLAACFAGGATVSNFGLNGLLPMDFEAMSNQLFAANFDYVIININNRSVSKDFDGADNQYSREWIGSKIDAPATLTSKFSLLKRAAYNEYPAELGKRHAEKIAEMFGLEREKSGALNIDMGSLLQLKSRYKTASFNTDASDQAKALQRLLSNPQVIAFRTIENKTVLDSVINTEDQAALANELTTLIESAKASKRVLTSPGNLEPSDFIDFMHVTPSGQRKYAEALCPQLATVLEN